MAETGEYVVFTGPLNTSSLPSLNESTICLPSPLKRDPSSQNRHSKQGWMGIIKDKFLWPPLLWLRGKIQRPWLIVVLYVLQFLAITLDLTTMRLTLECIALNLGGIGLSILFILATYPEGVEPQERTITKWPYVILTLIWFFVSVLATAMIFTSNYTQLPIRDYVAMTYASPSIAPLFSLWITTITLIHVATRIWFIDSTKTGILPKTREDLFEKEILV